MNELNKLIEQFAKEEDTPAFMIHALIREVEDEKGTWLNKLLDWLATRPTCGKEQRLFLDEVEKKGILGSVGGIIIKSKSDYKDPIVIEQSEFNADLSKVIKGK